MKLYDGGILVVSIIGLIFGGVSLTDRFKEPKIAVTQQLGEGRSVTCYVPQSQVTKDTTCVGEKS